METKEISLQVFERNLKVFNKKGLRRSYASVYKHWNEYMIIPPLGSGTKMVMECTVDKEFVDSLQELLKSKGFTVIGENNYFHIDNLVADYEKHKDSFKDNAKDIEVIAKTATEMKKGAAYKEIENEDVRFYFVPYTEDITTVYEFIKSQKDDLLEFSKKNDITLMLKIVGFDNQLDGFFGFNFFDADQEGEVVVDFAARSTVYFDTKVATSPYSAALLLTGLSDNPQDLSDPDLNVHIVADNLWYDKA